MARSVPVARPFPHVADHVVEPVTVRRETPDRRRTGMIVFIAVEYREETLPGICDRLSMRIVCARIIILTVAAAARGELPLRFGRKFVSAPLRVSKRILVGNMHNRVIFLAHDRAAGAGRLTPVRTGNVLPPLRDAAAAGDFCRGDKDHRARNQQVLGRAGMGLGVEPALGERPVTGRVYELPELRIRHLVTVDPEAIDAHRMDDAFFPLMTLRTHFECPAGDGHHAHGVAFPGRETAVADAASDLGLGAVALLGAGCERPGHDAAEHDDEPERTDQNAARHHWNAYVFWEDAGTGLYWNAKTRFQSLFMSITTHPIAGAASSALSSRPKSDLRS